MKPKINVVWLKRDLRTTDHAALAAAENAGLPYLILFLFEPTLLNRPDWSERHIVFQQQSIEDMNRQLSHAGMQVHIACALASCGSVGTESKSSSSWTKIITLPAEIFAKARS
jgi:deoxyribodipyrimidine photolyase